jgi:hypothetical protein
MRDRRLRAGFCKPPLNALGAWFDATKKSALSSSRSSGFALSLGLVRLIQVDSDVNLVIKDTACLCASFAASSGKGHKA